MSEISVISLSLYLQLTGVSGIFYFIIKGCREYSPDGNIVSTKLDAAARLGKVIASDPETGLPDASE